VKLTAYLLAYIPVGLPVFIQAIKALKKGVIFSEFTLMCIATLGAFFLKEYPEAVAVMLFYALGEAMQSLAVKRAKTNIESLLDQRPDTVVILSMSKTTTVIASAARPGDILLVKPGEKLALDGTMHSVKGYFDSAALTGESKPESKAKGDAVYAGMMNLN